MHFSEIKWGYMSNTLPSFIDVPDNVLSVDAGLKNIKSNQRQSNTTGQTGLLELPKED